ncbi:hypothetical protein ACLOJK_014380 [Asimina triloba]
MANNTANEEFKGLMGNRSRETEKRRNLEKVIEYGDQFFSLAWSPAVAPLLPLAISAAAAAAHAIATEFAGEVAARGGGEGEILCLKRRRKYGRAISENSTWWSWRRNERKASNQMKRRNRHGKHVCGAAAFSNLVRMLPSTAPNGKEPGKSSSNSNRGGRDGEMGTVRLRDGQCRRRRADGWASWRDGDGVGETKRRWKQKKGKTLVRVSPRQLRTKWGRRQASGRFA